MLCVPKLRIESVSFQFLACFSYVPDVPVGVGVETMLGISVGTAVCLVKLNSGVLCS